MQMLKKYIGLLLLLLSMITGLEAQSRQQFIDKAEEDYEYGDYANAAYLYQEALDFDTTDQNIRFRLGVSNLRYRAYNGALRCFDRLEQDGASLDSFPQLPYLQGKAAQSLGQYDRAIIHFSFFLNKPGNAPAYTIADAKRQLKNALWAEGIVPPPGTNNEGTQNKTLPILYTEVNTEYDDFGPFFERGQFYSSSLRFPMKKDSIKPNRLAARVLLKNSAEDEPTNPSLESISQKTRIAAHSAFNAAGTTVYFTYCEYVMDTLSLRCDLYSAPVSTNGTWGTPKKLPINASGANNTHPNVGMHPDSSEFLYFASDRSGGKGMHDLYRAPIGADGTLGGVESLDQLNTNLDDVTPFYYAPQSELYFSTDGRNTLGGFDVYRTSSIDTSTYHASSTDTSTDCAGMSTNTSPSSIITNIYRHSINTNTWMTPVHLGLPTNSSFNDVYYTRFEEQDTAYFASNRHNNSEAKYAKSFNEEEDVCCNEIYKIEIEKICFEVTTWQDTETDLNSTTVTLYEVLPNCQRFIVSETHPNNNRYEFKLEKGRKYVVTAVKRGLKGNEATVDSLSTMQVKDGECIKRELYLRPPTIKLRVVTLKKSDRSELSDCMVDLSPPLNNTTSESDTNLYTYNLELGRHYDISGSKEGYTSDSASVDTPLFILNDTVICRELLLKLKPMRCLTQTVFFHNDIPEEGNLNTTTRDDYIKTYDTYINTHKNDYYTKWADKGPNERSRRVRSAQLDLFFSKEVEKGAEDLKKFADTLKDYLANNGSLTVTLQGFASPRAKKSYNKKLSARRCISVINYLWNYEGGDLRQYMKNAVILINNKALEVPGQEVYNVPSPSYTDNNMDILVVPYQDTVPPPQPGKQLIFDIQPQGETKGPAVRGPNSIYAPPAAFLRYVEIKVKGCEEQPAEEIPEPPIRED
ncbi:MAG: tetratricopeptide (TPR) repeat protein [Limisphaerales bacterium]|jgi:tetratricopeptide (TPR) repeat protein